MKRLLNEVRRFQKIAGLLKEDDYDMGTPSGDTDAMNIAEEGDIDLSDTPEFNRYGFKVGDTVYYHLEGEPGEYGVVTDVARNWDEVLHKGGAGIEMWTEFFSDEEAAESLGYDTTEDWEAEFVRRLKSEPWFEIEDDDDERRTDWGTPGGWYPAEYVRA